MFVNKLTCRRSSNNIEVDMKIRFYNDALTSVELIPIGRVFKSIFRQKDMKTYFFESGLDI